MRTILNRKSIKTKCQAERGTTLVVVLIATAIIGATLGGYLHLVATQNNSVARSQAWNRAIPILEAGIEDAMAQLNYNARPASLVANGWELVGTNYVNTTSQGKEFAEVKIALLAEPIILSTGHALIPRGGGKYINRTVEARTRRAPLFPKAMAADGLIDLKGNNIETDSFNSSDPLGSINGRYDPSIRRANGDVATNGQLLNVGNADIYGRISTGPGGTNQINFNGSVGDLAWHAAHNWGVQPGYSTDDMNVDFPDRLAPYTVGLPPMGGNIGGTNYQYVLSGTGAEYSMSALNLSGTGSGSKMLVTGNVSLYVSGDVSISGSAGIILAPGASLRLYVAGANASIGGTGVMNSSGYAANFSYYGMPSNKNVSFNAGSSFCGTIYAPAAHLTLGGGGNTIYNFVGATVSKTVMMNGHCKFHYDEALATLAKPRDDDYYVIVSWNEL